jgi:hypothetical protein
VDALISDPSLFAIVGVVLGAALSATLAAYFLGSRAELASEKKRGRALATAIITATERSGNGSDAGPGNIGDSYAATLPKPTKSVVDFNLRLLDRYYEDTLGEYKLNSRASIIIASVGFVVILIGVGLALSNFVAVGTVTGLAGLVGEAATIMFFKQNELYAKQVQDYHKKLVSTQYLSTAISLAENLGNSTRDTEIKRLITNLLYLANELHGSRSPHLIGEVRAGAAGSSAEEPAFEASMKPD